MFMVSTEILLIKQSEICREIGLWHRRYVCQKQEGKEMMTSMNKSFNFFFLPWVYERKGEREMSLEMEVDYKTQNLG